MDKIINSVFLTVFAYILVLFLARIMGRKLISQMTFFDYIVGVALGSVTANLILAGLDTSGNLYVSIKHPSHEEYGKYGLE